MKSLPDIFLYSLWNGIIQKQQINKELKIMLAIDGSSYEYNDDDLKYLSILNETKNFEIIYISTKEIKSQKNNFKVFIIQPVKKSYERGLEYIIINLSRQNSKDWMQVGAKSEKVRQLPLPLVATAASSNFAITKTKVEIDTSYIFEKATYIGTINECLSIIRPWVHSLKKLEYEGVDVIPSRWRSIGLGRNALVPSFEPPWRASIAIDENKFPIFDTTAHVFLWSLRERIENLIATRNFIEEIKFERMKGIPNGKPEDVPNIISYYFGYFLMLIRGIFDSLTWITNWRIGRTNIEPYEISLYYSTRYRKFFNSLSKFNESLFNYIKSPRFQSYIQMIYSLRNSFAHTALPTSLEQAGILAGEFLVFRGNIIIKFKDFAKHNNLSNDNIAEIGIFFRNTDLIIEPVLFSKYMVMDVCKKIDYIIKRLYIHKKMIASATVAELKKFNELGKPREEEKAKNYHDSLHDALSFIEACVP